MENPPKMVPFIRPKVKMTENKKAEFNVRPKINKRPNDTKGRKLYKI